MSSQVLVLNAYLQLVLMRGEQRLDTKKERVRTVLGFYTVIGQN